jgi:hypothetical protein
MGSENPRTVKILLEIKREIENELSKEDENILREKLNIRLKEVNQKIEYLNTHNEKQPFLQDIIDKCRKETEEFQRFKFNYENKKIIQNIDEEINFWETIKACNYKDKSVIFNKNINIDEILIQLNKAKQEKKYEELEIWPVNVYYS